jgi:hypothetical protein
MGDESSIINTLNTHTSLLRSCWTALGCRVDNPYPRMCKR